jgi:hypothetical protein
MPWPANVRQALQGIAWICLVLAFAGYGVAIVRNVTNVLAGIAGHPRSSVLVETPNR